MSIVFQKIKDEQGKSFIRYFKKDKTSVDFLCPSCMLGYLEAAELFGKLKLKIENLQNITLKNLALNNAVEFEKFMLKANLSVV